MSHTPNYIQPYDMEQYDHEIVKFLNEVADKTDLSLTARCHLFSECFLGRPYDLGTCGEGAQAPFDQGPLYRSDQFDCVTYVNFVLALTFSQNLEQFRHNVLRVNYYDAEPVYEKRFHFMSVDWNPQNQNNGFVEDITLQIAKQFNEDVLYTDTSIDRPGFLLSHDFSNLRLLQQEEGVELKERLLAMRLLAATVETEHSQLPFLPATAFFVAKGEPREDLIAAIPEGSIIEIVQSNRDLITTIGTNIDVLHLGFGIWRHDKLWFRQASSMTQCVYDSLFSDYLIDQMSKQPGIGINVQRLSDIV